MAYSTKSLHLQHNSCSWQKTVMFYLEWLTYSMYLWYPLCSKCTSRCQRGNWVYCGECGCLSMYIEKIQFPSLKGNQASHISPTPQKPPMGKASATARWITLEDVQVMIHQESFLTEMSSLKIAIIIGRNYESVLTTQREKGLTDVLLKRTLPQS